MENKQKIHEIRTERAENSKRILKLKQEICELENLSCNYKYNMNDLEPEENRNKYFACSLVMGLGFILGEVMGGLFGLAGNNVLLGLLGVLPFTSISAFGSAYSFIKAIKFNKFKNKKVKDNPHLENEINLKYDELERLEQLDHELYTQLCTELSKTSTGFIEKSSKHQISVPIGTYMVDDNITEL